MHDNNITEESKNDQIRRLLHNCNKFLYYHVGLGAQQNKAIKFLMTGPASQKELQEHLGVKPASVSELITKLESRGIVERSRNESDRRVVILSLTENGRNIGDKIKDVSYSDELFSSLDEVDKDQLIALLEKVHKGFTDSEQDKSE